MKKIITSIAVVLMAQGIYAETVYETDANGVASFSSYKTKGAKVVDLKDDPVTVLNSNTQQAKNEVTHLDNIASSYRKHYRPYGNNDTLQGSFPELNTQWWDV